MDGSTRSGLLQGSFRVHDLRLSLAVSGVICLRHHETEGACRIYYGKTMRLETSNPRQRDRVRLQEVGGQKIDMV